MNKVIGLLLAHTILLIGVGAGYIIGLNACRPITKEFHTILAPDHGAGHRALRRWHRDLTEKRPRTERAICIVEEVR